MSSERPFRTDRRGGSGPFHAGLIEARVAGRQVLHSTTVLLACNVSECCRRHISGGSPAACTIRFLPFSRSESGVFQFLVEFLPGTDTKFAF